MKRRAKKTETCRDCHFLALQFTGFSEWPRDGRATLTKHDWDSVTCYRGKWPSTKDMKKVEEIVAEDRKGAGCFLPYVPGETFQAGEHREEHEYRRRQIKRNKVSLWVGVATLLAAIGAIVATCGIDATRGVVPTPTPDTDPAQRTTPVAARPSDWSKN